MRDRVPPPGERVPVDGPHAHNLPASSDPATAIMAVFALLNVVLGLSLSTRPPAVMRRCSSCAMAAELPGSPKDLAEEASLAVQAALGAGCRRLEIAVPDGLCFFNAGKQEMIGDPNLAPPQATKDKGDRDLAYLVCEMFKPLGTDVVCVLGSENALAIASREWSKGGLQTRLVASASELASRGGRGGFGAGAAAGAPSPPRVVVLVLRARCALPRAPTSINDTAIVSSYFRNPSCSFRNR